MSAVAVGSTRRSGGLLLGDFGDHGFGGEHQRADGTGVLERGAGHFGRVDDAGGNQVFVGAGGGVEAEARVVGGKDLLANDGAFEPGVADDLAQGLCAGAAPKQEAALLSIIDDLSEKLNDFESHASVSPTRAPELTEAAERVVSEAFERLPVTLGQEGAAKVYQYVMQHVKRTITLRTVRVGPSDAGYKQEAESLAKPDTYPMNDSSSTSVDTWMSQYGIYGSGTTVGALGVHRYAVDVTLTSLSGRTAYASGPYASGTVLRK